MQAVTAVGIAAGLALGAGAPAPADADAVSSAPADQAGPSWTHGHRYCPSITSPLSRDAAAGVDGAAAQ